MVQILKPLLLTVMLSAAIAVGAQTKHGLATLRSWEHSEAVGDLNRDGINDLVIIATPADKAHMKVRDDGYVYNFNQPVLAIFKGKAGGGFEPWKEYDNVIPARPEEYVSISHSVSVSNRNTFTVGIEYFFSMGGWDSPSYAYVFRYQDGDFYLIGMEENHMTRNTGETECESYNYLTHKKLRTTGNATGKNGKSTSKWSNLPQEPLKRLGTWTLGE